MEKVSSNYICILVNILVCKCMYYVYLCLLFCVLVFVFVTIGNNQKVIISKEGLSVGKQGKVFKVRKVWFSRI